MNDKEALKGFYHLHKKDSSEVGQFNVYKREDFACDDTSLQPNRRDFYKISLVTKGEGVFSYADKSIALNNSAFTFLNPLIPYDWAPVTKDQKGYFCLFTEEFINSNLKTESLAQSPLFKPGGNHILIPDQKTMTFLSSVFEKMIGEMQSSYVNKYDLLRSYVQIIIHEALKIQPPDTYFEPNGNASSRICSMFFELMDKQFPIDSPLQTLKFKTANEFAAQLSIHTNHLNRALKEITGKTTSEWIAERIIKEAKALLLHSNWNVAEIGYCLGFEHPSNFNIFFRKNVLYTPNQFRRQVASIS